MKKRDKKRIQVEADPEFLKDLLWYQGQVLKNEATRLGSGPAIKKAATLYIRARKAEAAAGG